MFVRLDEERGRQSPTSLALNIFRGVCGSPKVKSRNAKLVWKDTEHVPFSAAAAIPLFVARLSCFGSIAAWALKYRSAPRRSPATTIVVVDIHVGVDLFCDIPHAREAPSNPISHEHRRDYGLEPVGQGSEKSAIWPLSPVLRPCRAPRALRRAST